MIDWLTGGLTDRLHYVVNLTRVYDNYKLIVWLKDSVIGWLTGGLSDRLYCVVNWTRVYINYKLIVWLNDWPIASVKDWRVGWLSNRLHWLSIITNDYHTYYILIVWLSDGPAACLTDWLARWLTTWPHWVVQWAWGYTNNTLIVWLTDWRHIWRVD